MALWTILTYFQGKKTQLWLGCPRPEWLNKQISRRLTLCLLVVQHDGGGGGGGGVGSWGVGPREGGAGRQGWRAVHITGRLFVWKRKSSSSIKAGWYRDWINTSLRTPINLTLDEQKNWRNSHHRAGHRLDIWYLIFDGYNLSQCSVTTNNCHYLLLISTNLTYRNLSKLPNRSESRADFPNNSILWEICHWNLKQTDKLSCKIFLSSHWTASGSSVFYPKWVVSARAGAEHRKCSNWDKR